MNKINFSYTPADEPSLFWKCLKRLKVIQDIPEDHFIAISSSPLTKEQQDIIKKIPFESLSVGEAYVLDPSRFYFGLQVVALNTPQIPKVWLIPARHHRGDLPHIEDIEKNYVCKPFPITRDQLCDYAVALDSYRNVQILVTDFCNVQYEQCSFKSEDETRFNFIHDRLPREKCHISLERAEKFMIILDKGADIRLGGFGEPLMHPQIVDIVQLTTKYGLNATLQTNATLLSEKMCAALADAGLGQLDYNISAIDNESYKKICLDGDLDIVLENIARAKRFRDEGRANWRLGINYSSIHRGQYKDEEIVKFFAPYVDSVTFRVSWPEAYTERCLNEAGQGRSVFSELCYEMEWGPILGSDGAVFPCSTVANISVIEDTNWIKNIDDDDIEDIYRDLKTQVRDESSEFCKLCKKCMFHPSSIHPNGHVANTYFTRYQNQMQIEKLVDSEIEKLVNSRVEDHGYNKLNPETAKADAEYTFSVASLYLRNFLLSGITDVSGLRILELGPGTNFGTVFVFKALGASEVHVADRFLVSYDTQYHQAVYTVLKEMVKEAYPQAALDIFDQCIVAKDHVAEGLFCYMTGMEDLSSIKTSSIDIIVSNAVFEHLADPPAAFRELSRVSAPGALGSHQVDFRYHNDFSRPLEFLLMPDDELHAFTSARDYICGNGWRPREYHELFKECGFEVIRESPDIFAEDLYMDVFMPRLHKSSSRFRSFSREELREISSHFMVSYGQKNNSV